MKALATLFLTAFTASAAIITGPLQDISAGTYNTSGVEFWPMSTPTANGTSLVVGPKKTVQPTNGNFAVSLVAGRYLVKFLPTTNTVYIWVPNDSSSYTVASLATNATATSTVDGAPIYKVRISSTDSNQNYLAGKILPGSNVTFATNNTAGTITISSTGGGGAGFNPTQPTNYNGTFTGNGSALTNLPSFTNTSVLYVDLLGSDSNPGTREKPFKTIQAAKAASSYGTLIVVGAGSNFITTSVTAPAGGGIVGVGPETHIWSTNSLANQGPVFVPADNSRIGNFTLHSQAPFGAYTDSVYTPPPASATNWLFENFVIWGRPGQWDNIDGVVFSTGDRTWKGTIRNGTIYGSYDAFSFRGDDFGAPAKFEVIIENVTCNLTNTTGNIAAMRGATFKTLTNSWFIFRGCAFFITNNVNPAFSFAVTSELESSADSWAAFDNCRFYNGGTNDIALRDPMRMYFSGGNFADARIYNSGGAAIQYSPRNGYSLTNIQSAAIVDPTGSGNVVKSNAPSIRKLTVEPDSSATRTALQLNGNTIHQIQTTNYYGSGGSMLLGRVALHEYSLDDYDEFNGGSITRWTANGSKQFEVVTPNFYANGQYLTNIPAVAISATSGQLPMGTVSSGLTNIAGPMLTTNGAARYYSYNGNLLTNLNTTNITLSGVTLAGSITNLGNTGWVGPINMTNPVTGGVIILSNAQINVIAQASASTREVFYSARLSDSGNDLLSFGNATSADGRFNPLFAGFQNNANNVASFQLRGLTTDTNDTSDSAFYGMVDILAARTTSTIDPNNGSLSAIANRKVFSVRSAVSGSAADNSFVIWANKGATFYGGITNSGSITATNGFYHYGTAGYGAETNGVLALGGNSAAAKIVADGTTGGQTNKGTLQITNTVAASSHVTISAQSGYGQIEFPNGYIQLVTAGLKIPSTLNVTPKIAFRDGNSPTIDAPADGALRVQGSLSSTTTITATNGFVTHTGTYNGSAAGLTNIAHGIFEASYQTNGSSTAVTQDVWTQVANNLNLTSGLDSEWVVATNALVYTGTKQRMIHMFVTLSATVGAGNKNVKFALAKSGTRIVPSETIQTVSGSQYNSTALHPTIAMCSTGDAFQLYMNNATDGTAITVVDMNMGGMYLK